MLFTFPLRYWFTIGLLEVFSLTRWCWQIQAGFLRSRLTQDTARPQFFALTGLSPAMVQLSRRFSLKLVSKCGPTTPARHAGQVWAIPFSLATTWGIIIYFLFLLLLRCFSSEGWLPVFRRDNTPSVCWVVPFGNLRILRLCAAPRSLSQLTTSFFVSKSQGIHHTPLSALKELLFVTRHLQLLKFTPNMSKNFQQLLAFSF